MAFTSPAAAQAPPENPVQGVAAIDQYVEALPSASGPKATGSAVGKRIVLPAAVAASLRERAGEDSDALLEIATSPEFGSPPAGPTSEAIAPTPETPSDKRSSQDGETTAFGEVVAPVGEADEPRLLILLAALGVVTVVAVAGAIRRRRSQIAR